MMRQYFVGAGCKLDTLFLTDGAQDKVFLPLLIRQLRVVEPTDYSSIHVYPRCRRCFCMGLKTFGLMNQACDRVHMLVKDEASHELDALVENYCYTQRVLGCISNDHGAPTKLPTEEAVFEATQV